MLQNITGQEVNYELFKQEYDADPALQELIKNFDSHGVTINTTKKDLTRSNKNKGQAHVNSMAKRAASKVINR